MTLQFARTVPTAAQPSLPDPEDRDDGQPELRIGLWHHTATEGTDRCRLRLQVYGGRAMSRRQPRRSTDTKHVVDEQGVRESDGRRTGTALSVRLRCRRRSWSSRRRCCRRQDRLGCRLAEATPVMRLCRRDWRDRSCLSARWTSRWRWSRRSSFRKGGAGDPRLRDAGAVDVGATDGAREDVGPVDEVAVDGDRAWPAGAGDEGLGGDRAGAESGGADFPIGVRPVDLAAVYRDRYRRVSSGDECLASVAAGQPGGSNRVVAGLGEVDLARVDGYAGSA